VGVAELEEFPELVELNLKENQVKGFGDILKIGSLQYLDVSSNAICGVLPRINMPNLRVLDISNNKITDIRSLSSSSLPCLNYLIISQNHIK
jgi:internalin A